jgi:hypothetical protein
MKRLTREDYRRVAPLVRALKLGLDLEHFDRSQWSSRGEVGRYVKSLNSYVTALQGKIGYHGGVEALTLRGDFEFESDYLTWLHEYIFAQVWSELVDRAPVGVRRLLDKIDGKLLQLIDATGYEDKVRRRNGQ